MTYFTFFMIFHDIIPRLIFDTLFEEKNDASVYKDSNAICNFVKSGGRLHCSVCLVPWLHAILAGYMLSF